MPNLVISNGTYRLVKEEPDVVEMVIIDYEPVPRYIPVSEVLTANPGRIINIYV